MTTYNLMTLPDEPEFDESALRFADIERRLTELENLAHSWPLMVSTVATVENATPLVDTQNLTEELADLEAKHGVVLELVEEIRAIIKPSTSKLANSLRDAIQRWAAPVVKPEPADGEPCPVHGWTHQFKTCEEVTAEQSAAPPAVEEPPSDDADVWAWRVYAINLGHNNVQVGKMNRSQIRTLLGMAHPGQDD